MDQLSRADRLRLMRFVCSFAWSDLQVTDAERKLVAHLAQRLQLSDDERAEVQGWLKVPPRPEQVDPQEIPAQHRSLFIEAARATISVDGAVTDAEREAFDLLERMLREP